MRDVWFGAPVCDAVPRLTTRARVTMKGMRALLLLVCAVLYVGTTACSGDASDAVGRNRSVDADAGRSVRGDAANSGDGGTIIDGALVQDAASDTGTGTDGGMPDARALDGGPNDGGSVDGGPDDGGSSDDGGAGDGGVDDGSVGDGGSGDGGSGDGGPSDAGVIDAQSIDASNPDGGQPTDASVDSAPPDAGLDPPARILINEVVFYPENDWNHSDGLAQPFSGAPGVGSITSSDQFVELRSVDTRVLDVRDFSVEIRDFTGSTTFLGQGSSILRLTSGSTLDAFQPGHFLLIGDPVGFSSTDALVILRDEQGRVLDQVEVGGFIPQRDFELDGIGDGAPSPDANAFARGSFDEAVARPDGVPDTDNDTLDFVKMYATPLAPNVNPPLPVESIPPSIVRHTGGGTREVTGRIYIEFDDSMEHVSADRNITVLADGFPIDLDFHTFEDSDHTVVLHPVGRLPFDASITVQVRGGAAGITDLAGNPLPADYAFGFRTESMPANPAPVVLNEMCLSPQQDWDDSEGGDGAFYSAVPGIGLVASEDEWIELLHRGTNTVNARGYEIVVYNGYNLFGPAVSRTSLSSTTAHITVRGTGTLDALAPGDRVVIGNPRGSMFADAVIELRNFDGDLIDMVEVGGNARESDRGGDGPQNGAPGTGFDGESTSVFDEVVARFPDGVDTGDDEADFSHATATIGSQN